MSNGHTSGSGEFEIDDDIIVLRQPMFGQEAPAAQHAWGVAQKLDVGPPLRPRCEYFLFSNGSGIVEPFQRGPGVGFPMGLVPDSLHTAVGAPLEAAPPAIHLPVGRADFRAAVSRWFEAKGAAVDVDTAYDHVVSIPADLAPEPLWTLGAPFLSPRYAPPGVYSVRQVVIEDPGVVPANSGPIVAWLWCPSASTDRDVWVYSPEYVQLGPESGVTMMALQLEDMQVEQRWVHQHPDAGLGGFTSWIHATFGRPVAGDWNVEDLRSFQV